MREKDKSIKDKSFNITDDILILRIYISTKSVQSLNTAYQELAIKILLVRIDHDLVVLKYKVADSAKTDNPEKLQCVCLSLSMVRMVSC